MIFKSGLRNGIFIGKSMKKNIGMLVIVVMLFVFCMGKEKENNR